MAKEKLIWNHDVLKLIRDARSTKHSDRIVLNALAIRVDPRERHSCWPGQPLLVIDTQLDLKTVRAALDRLEADGLIARKKRFDKTDMYWINIALLQRQAAANKAIKDAMPECPFDAPTLEQEKQLEADEAKVAFDEGPAADPNPAGGPSAARASDEEPGEPETSPVSAAIQALDLINQKMSAKQADSMARSLMKSHAENDVLQAIASLDAYALREAFKATNPIGYLRRSINNALKDIEKPEPVLQNIESSAKDEGSESGERSYDLDELRTCIQAIVDDDASSEKQWEIPTTWDEEAFARCAADIAQLSDEMIKLRGPFAIDWDDSYWATTDRALYDRYIVLVKAQNKTVQGERTLQAHG